MKKYTMIGYTFGFLPENTTDNITGFRELRRKVEGKNLKEIEHKIGVKRHLVIRNFAAKDSPCPGHIFYYNRKNGNPIFELRRI